MKNRAASVWFVLSALVTPVPSQAKLDPAGRPAAPGGATASREVVGWRSDFEEARAEAQRKRLPLLVCFPTDSRTDVYRDARLAAALRNVVTVVALPGEAGAVAPGRQAGDAVARRYVFGEVHELTRPQHVILHPDGGVLWHESRAVDAKTLQQGIERAQRAGKDSAAVRASRARARLVELTKGASDRSDLEKVFVLLAHASSGEFVQLFSAIANRDVASRLVGELGRRHPERAVRLLPQLDSGADKALRATVSSALSGAEEILRKRQAEGREALVPLRVLGTPGDLTDVTFADGIGRTLASYRGRVIMLWFFRPDDPALHQQVTELRRLVADYERFGLVVIGLGASLDPAHDARSLAELGLAFPAAAYRYDQERPREGICWFPSRIIVDAEGRTVYRTTQHVNLPDDFEPTLRSALASARAAIGPAPAKR